MCGYGPENLESDRITVHRRVSAKFASEECPRVRFPVRTVAFAVRYPVRSGIRVAVSLHGYCSVLVLPLYRSDTAFLRA